MCDTMVALGNSTLNGQVIFAKNSDREPNEAHEVVIIPAEKHVLGSRVKCTYIEIPQVSETYKVLLAKPFWIWGAEMGSNEYGVTIGNEAVFTRISAQKRPGLIGMDFLRLALERSKNAYEALTVITGLLEEYGQGGNCGFAHPLFYDNSFLICDAKEAWVLETAGREWAAEQVDSVRSISNAITITDKWDVCSKTLVSTAVKNGWCKDRTDFSFSRCYSEPVYTTFSDARRRQTCSTNHLLDGKGGVTVKSMMKLLRHHRDDGKQGWSPDKGVTGADICMHAGWGPIRGSQTTGSMISVIKQGQAAQHWVTTSSAPCTSIFKPIWMDSTVPARVGSPKGFFDPDTLYWNHERLHRRLLKSYIKGRVLIDADRDRFESELINAVESGLLKSAKDRTRFSEKAFDDADELEQKWYMKIDGDDQEDRRSFLYRLSWNRFNREARM
jgi:secernin